MGFFFTSRNKEALDNLLELKEFFKQEIEKYMKIPLKKILESEYGFATCPACYEEFKDIDEIIAHLHQNKKEFETVRESSLGVEIEENQNEFGGLLLILRVCGFKSIAYSNDSSTEDDFKGQLNELINNKDKVCDLIFFEVMKYKLYEEMQKRKHESWREENKKGIKTDDRGYKRGKISHSDLIHRQVAYNEIYLKNREDYPLPFEKYVVHHKDGNKQNNKVSNLKILTKEEHEATHKK